MSKKLFASLFSIILSHFTAFANEITLTGTVTDNRNNPVEFANIIIPNTSVGTITDSSGRYLLKFDSDTAVTIKVSFTGYVTESKRINASGTFNFKLSTSFTELTEVRVANQREREVSQIRLNPKMLEFHRRSLR